ncbi:hypothetical protein [Thauera humireducens]|uniref:Uncharacterized protein n=1 Tax=Thauera humireducens TaxID=1134435 RepID=A0A127K3W7_9RHOO|nr:hypothetical protein [Thauera humireducens]AMO36653.1 hypothetical protein AC731_006685 [Thauera humireducens]
MKRIITGLALSIALVGPAAAACVGSGSLRTCMDDSGNTYTVQRLGNTTYVDGSNPNGSRWSQESTTIGNTTFHNGTAADGGSWNGTTTRIGNTVINSGTDSDGNPYSSSCYGRFCD